MKRTDYSAGSPPVSLKRIRSVPESEKHPADAEDFREKLQAEVHRLFEVLYGRKIKRRSGQ